LEKISFSLIDDSYKKEAKNCLNDILKDEDIVECKLKFLLSNGAKIETEIEGILFKIDEDKLVLMRLKNGKKDLKELVENSFKKEQDFDDFTKKIEQYLNLYKKWLI